jgi:hypothetical protein
VADLITHACTALLAKLPARRPVHVATFLAGTALPDLIGRVPSMALTRIRYTLPDIPEALIYPWNVVHMPFGLLCAAYLLAFVFPQEDRPPVFRNLVGGGLLHLAVDLLQFHFGVGYLLLFPFSTWDYEIGCIGSEDTVRIVPVLAPLTALLAWLRWGRRAADAPTGG